MEIRLGQTKDKEEYLTTQKEAFPIMDPNRDAKFFDEKIKNKEIFILEESDEYLGHICFGKHILNPPFAGSVFIEEFAVKEKFRSQGFGTALIKELVNFCKKNKISSIHLGTGEEPNRAIKYYEKMGFKKVGWLKDIDPNSEYSRPQLFYAIMVKDWENPI
ncbi:MAG: GNAT family N-acetyltransferase [Nanoarchaeota archaeon]|nr:GNAT family N-acetyltransferase [Nanoarchaeota archaeon]